MAEYTVKLMLSDDEEKGLLVYARVLGCSVDSLMTRWLTTHPRFKAVMSNPLEASYNALKEMMDVDREMDKILGTCEVKPTSEAEKPVPVHEPVKAEETISSTSKPYFVGKDFSKDRIVEIVNSHKEGIKTYGLLEALNPGDKRNEMRQSYNNLYNVLKVLLKEGRIDDIKTTGFKTEKVYIPCKKEEPVVKEEPVKKETPVSPPVQKEKPKVEEPEDNRIRMNDWELMDSGLKCQLFMRNLAATPEGEHVDLNKLIGLFIIDHTEKSVRKAMKKAFDGLYAKRLIKYNSEEEILITSAGRKAFKLQRLC